jgi:hypothetical protein
MWWCNAGRHDRDADCWAGTNIANQQEQLSQQTLAAEQQAATGDFAASILKGAAAVATLV